MKIRKKKLKPKREISTFSKSQMITKLKFEKM